jgi:ketosteroid isomerase-like protein
MNQKLISTESSSRGEARNADAAVVVAEIGENRHEIIDHIYHEWDDALSKLDVERLLALYAPDATLESPLIRHLLKTDRGVLHGHDQLRKLFDELARTQPETRKFYRKGYFTDGKMLIWEYPRKSPEDDQQDFVEVIEIEDGLIKSHRVYWGWFGVRVLERGEHFRNKA